VRLTNPRDFAQGNYKRVDDRPFGGGPGMVMLAEPLQAALQAVQADRADGAPVLLFSPWAGAWTMPRWSAGRTAAGAVLVCGRYEGVDQRFADAHVDEQVEFWATLFFLAVWSLQHGAAGRRGPLAAGRAGRCRQPPHGRLQPRA